ncbi:GTPase-activating protein BEM3 KNAG_0J01310 [Huiozyma naganishii CBS 8797]|uniref:Rho-GAP domain-containing protein n=1 Tax=Huiozyma naganishii (strain ATCC MYA-139 / BCRC 22969 / CBS 8797 / KCTC 17520 / NBRC 10181 / NCYC 3082 / Yp74L-3) TaxID=1071383 RepID=J7S2S4_HUIN7|nr:hypothetical protein KNAG_0J01310 [Kazachstania naganishii CBS 8797]CCK72212.1 hypothetical protein KNAG_0J01310 [Kazachstania naganishii CBS 8797]
MESPIGTKTLDLLKQYNNHISERDKSIEYIEKNTESASNRPTYDELFKENVKLKLQVDEYDAELKSLKQVIELLKKHNNTSIETLLEENLTPVEKKKDFILPPRSAERRMSGKDSDTQSIISSTASSYSKSNEVPRISLPGKKLISGMVDNPPSPATTIKTSTSDAKSPLKSDDVNLRALNNNPFIDPILSPSNSGSTESPGKPTASVTYTTSRIQIKSPKKTQSPVQERARSPQNPNRMTSVINNQIRSPLKKTFVESRADFNCSPTMITENIPPRDKFGGDSLNYTHPINTRNMPLQTKDDSSESGNSPLSARTNSVRNVSGEHYPPSDSLSINSINKSITQSSRPTVTTPPPNTELGSPILLNKNDSHTSAMKSTLPSTLNNKAYLESALDLHIKTKVAAEKMEDGLKKPTMKNSSLPAVPATLTAGSRSVSSQILKVQDDFNPDVVTDTQRSISTGTVQSHVASMVSEIPLFVQPDEFGTIKLEIVSSLFQENDLDRDEHLVLISVIDRKTDKEMFKFSKSIQKIRELDVYMKSHISNLSLPSLPDRSLFQAIIPAKVAMRRELLNEYFASIFSVPAFPPNVSLKIAQFLSTDTVMNPPMLGDTTKEGTVVMRRPKKALSNNIGWRIRYAILNDGILQLLERDQIAEVIKLQHCAIEIIPNIPEDRYGTKNGFLINEHKKSGLSSISKYYICLETAKERESWLSALNQLTGQSLQYLNAHSPNMSHGDQSSQPNSVEGANSLSKTDSSSIIDQNYSSNELRVEQKSTQPLGRTSSHTSVASSPRQPDVADERDIRRLKMRSLFPFKKLNISSNSTGVQGGAPSTTPSDFEPVTILTPDSSKSLTTQKSAELNSSQIELSYDQPVVFGSSLDACLKLSSHLYQGEYDIPTVVYRCLEYLYKNQGIREEGIFRLSGSSTLIKTLQETFDRDHDVDLCNYEEEEQHAYLGVNTVSGLLKLYLRNLPHLIFGDEQFLTLKKIVSEYHSNDRAIAFEYQKLIQQGQLPHANISLMYALFELLNRIIDNKKFNKMNLRNLCIVFSSDVERPNNNAAAFHR